jgi:antirestriction protein ArdC
MTTRHGSGPAGTDKLEELHDQLIEAVADLASSEAWIRMLAVAARFHDYSPSNILLIGAQRPDATRVAGIRTWNSLGRRVLKGQHGIAILAPCVYRSAPGETAPERNGTAREGSSPGLASNAASPTRRGSDDDEPSRHLRGFKVVHVFDVEQTDGDPLPDVAPEHITGAEPEGLWNHLAGLVHADGYRLERGPIRLGNGYTDYRTRTVRIGDDLEPAQAVKTLAHELGHIRADHEHRFTDYATSRECRGQAEVEAESIAYLITAQAGLDSASYSVPYLAGWSGGNIDLLRESMSKVIGVARAAVSISSCGMSVEPPERVTVAMAQVTQHTWPPTLASSPILAGPLG